MQILKFTVPSDIFSPSMVQTLVVTGRRAVRAFNSVVLGVPFTRITDMLLYFNFFLFLRGNAHEQTWSGCCDFDYFLILLYFFYVDLIHKYR